MALALLGCDGRELNEAFVVGQELVVAGDHATELLPLADEPLSPVALPGTPCCRRGCLAVDRGGMTAWVPSSRMAPRRGLTSYFLSVITTSGSKPSIGLWLRVTSWHWPGSAKGLNPAMRSRLT